MTVITLYLWTVVAGNHSGYAVRDWRHMGEFASVAHCEKAREKLGVIAERARCVDTGLPANKPQ